jgi:hypothetical protein
MSRRLGRSSGRIFSRCVHKTGIAPFGALVDQVMATEPYRSAKRVFWIVDNGSSHRGLAAVEREQARHPNLRLIHCPIHSSWLNQVEIYLSIVDRKVLTSNDFPDLAEVERRLHRLRAPLRASCSTLPVEVHPSGSRQPASPAQGALGRGLTYTVELMILST